MTFLSPLLMVGVFALVGYLSSLNKEKVRTISILDESGQFSNEFKSTKTLKFNIIDNVALTDAKSMSETSKDYGLVYIPKVSNLTEYQDQIKFFSEDSPSLEILNKVENTIENKVEDICARLIFWQCHATEDR